MCVPHTVRGEAVSPTCSHLAGRHSLSSGCLLQLDNISTHPAPCTAGLSMHGVHPQCRRGIENISLAFLHLSSVFLYCRPQVRGLSFPSLYSICSYPISGTQVWPDAFTLSSPASRASDSLILCGFGVRDGSKSHYCPTSSRT